MEHNNEQAETHVTIGNRDAQRQKPWGNLGREWSQFLGVLLGPLVLVFLVLTIVFIALSLYLPNQPTGQGTSTYTVLQAVVTLIISLLAGIVGAILSDRWTKSRDASVLATRGKSAVRGLKVLIRNISMLEARTVYYASLVTSTDKDGAIGELSYSEIVSRCIALQEQALNAIEEWQDILPELSDLKTQIGVISDLKQQESALKQQESVLNQQVVELQKQLERKQAESSTSSKERQRLEKELKEKEEELRKTQGALNRKQSVLGDLLTPTPGLVFTGERTIPIVTDSILGRKCANCGAVIDLGSGITVLDKCPQCGRSLYPYTWNTSSRDK